MRGNMDISLVHPTEPELSSENFHAPSYGAGLPPSPQRRPAPTPTRWSPKELNEKHEEIIRLAHIGMKQEQIAEEMGLSAQIVHMLLKTELAQRKLEDLASFAEMDTLDTHAEIQKASKEAVVYLSEVIRGKVETSASLRAKASMDMLDRAGFSPVKKVEKSVSGYMVQVGLEKIMNRAKELGISSLPIAEQVYSQSEEAMA